MINYLAYLLVPSLIAFYAKDVSKFKNYLWFLIFFFLLFLSTFRNVIGSDQGDYYFTYMQYYFDLNFEKQNFPNYEFIYSSIELISAKLKLGFQGVNFFCSLIYLLGLFLLIKNEKLNWFCLFISLPYFYFAVSWGFLRQGLALGFIFLSIYSYKNKNFFLFFLFLFLSIFSHKFAIIFSPILLLALSSKKTHKIIFTLFGIIILISLIYFVLIIDVSYYKQFISEVPQSYTSKGSILRSGMSFVVALLFFLNMNQMKKYQDYQLYFYVSIICVLLFPLSFFLPIPATRIGVYFGFIQFIILPRYVDLLRGNKRFAIILFIFLMYLFVFIMWLVYSPQKELWVPYYFSFQ